MKPDFKAQLTFIAGSNETSRSPVASGYRAAIHFSFSQDVLVGIFSFLETELVFPGDTAQAEITLPDAGNAKLYEGMDFDFFENSILVGQGVVTKMY